MEITVNDIQNLVIKAKGGAVESFFQDSRKKDVALLTTKIKDLKTRLKELETAFKGKDFSDKESLEKDKQVLEVYTGVLIPTNNEYADNINKQLETLNVSVQEYLRLFVGTKREIESLKETLESLKDEAENYTGDALMPIVTRINEVQQKIESYEQVQRIYHGQLIDLSTREVGLEAELAENKARKADLDITKNNLKAGIKGQYVRVIDQAIAEAQIISLKNEIDFLEERKKVLAKDPEKLGQEIITLIEQNGNSDEIKTKLNILTMLANYKVDSIATYDGSVGYQRVESKKTKGQILEHINLLEAALSDLYKSYVAQSSEVTNLVVRLVTFKEIIAECEEIQVAIQDDDKLREVTELLELSKKSLKKTKADLNDRVCYLNSLSREQREKNAQISSLRTYLMLQESGLTDTRNIGNRLDGIEAVMHFVRSEETLESPKEIQTKIEESLPTLEFKPVEESYDLDLPKQLEEFSSELIPDTPNNLEQMINENDIDYFLKKIELENPIDLAPLSETEDVSLEKEIPEVVGPLKRGVQTIKQVRVTGDLGNLALDGVKSTLNSEEYFSLESIKKL